MRKTISDLFAGPLSVLNVAWLALVFSFSSSVLLASSGGPARLTPPMGYQTNLMVYGPGGYRFYDYFIVGLPLQIILTLVIPLGIFLIWGI